MPTIAEIRKQIVEAIEAGEDTSKLETQLKQARLAEQTKAEVAELEVIAGQRQEAKKKADNVVAKAERQAETIDVFLAARDAVIGPLAEALEKARELPQLLDGCFAEFHDGIQAGYIVRATKGFLPDDFTVPMVQLGKGDRDAYDVAREALVYIQSGHGLLANLQRVDLKPHPQEEEPY